MDGQQDVTAQRLKQRMEEVGISATALAEQIGVSPAAISHILTGRSRNSRHLPRIATSLAVNLNWLLGVTDDKIDMFDDKGGDIDEDHLAGMIAGLVPKRLVHPDQLRDRRLPFHGAEPIRAPDHVEIRMLDLALGFGANYFDVPIKEERRLFSREWLRGYTRADPDNVLIAHGVGDSMAPTLLDSDLLIIDTSQNILNIADKIWAVAYGEVGGVKRLRPLPGGGVQMIADNPQVPDAVAYDGELHILGRVVGFQRKL